MECLGRCLSLKMLAFELLRSSSMKTQNMIAGLALSVLLGSCGKGPALLLTIRLPQGLAKGTNRHDRFLKRVTHLRLGLESKGGTKTEVIAGPQDWERLSLPAIDFPVDDKDSLSIVAEVWDMTSEGNARSYAVAKGDASLSATALRTGGITAVVIPLSLKVGVGEYDR